jgi:hypothetical protein
MVQPYGKRRLLNYLELLTLTAIWLTLWAGNVFNANPRCEDGKGGTVAWCDTISIAVGMIDVVMLIAVGATMVYYKKQTQCDACLGSLGNRFHHKLEEEEEGMESADVTSFTNPTLDPATANSAPHVNIEMTNLAAVAIEMKTDVASSGQHERTVTHLPDNWQRHVDTETGSKYYEKPNGRTQWDRPECEENSHMWDEFTTEDGDTFYVDSNGQTHWEKPTTKFYDNAMQKK